MFFYTPLMLLLYLLFACLLYFTCLYIVRNDENKDVQSLSININVTLSDKCAPSSYMGHSPSGKIGVWEKSKFNVGFFFFF